MLNLKLKAMFDFLKVGGILGMVVITICALLVLIFTIVKGYDVFVRKNIDKKGLIGILFFGSMAPLVGIIWQMIGMMQAFTAIEQAGDISPSLMMGGLRVSMFAPLYGLIVLFFSAIFWFILKWKIESMNK